MSKNAVGWFEIYVQDMPRAKAFYEGVLNVQLQHLDTAQFNELEMWSFPMTDGTYGASGALVKMEGSSSGCGGTMVYFSCEDCAEETARVLPLGGKICKDKFSIDQYGFISIVTDTEGNVIGLHSMK